MTQEPSSQPHDRPRLEVYSRPFSTYHYVISADELAVPRFAKARSSTFMVLMLTGVAL